jgi:hypothetical protein
MGCIRSTVHVMNSLDVPLHCEDRLHRTAEGRRCVVPIALDQPRLIHSHGKLYGPNTMPGGQRYGYTPEINWLRHEVNTLRGRIQARDA